MVTIVPLINMFYRWHLSVCPQSKTRNKSGQKRKGGVVQCYAIVTYKYIMFKYIPCALIYNKINIQYLAVAVLSYHNIV